ncbi:MAG: DUF3617 domain-containing protein [Vicinamibacterales bacterium]
MNPTDHGVKSTIGTALILAGLLAAAAGAAGPVPPIKAGLWEVRMSTLDADGRPMPAPGMEGLANMPPEMRARMEEALKARGASLPDASGAIKTCLSKDQLSTDRWQQQAAESGCTTTYASQSGSTWTWHSTCAGRFAAEADGETTFTGTEAYRTKVVTTSTIRGKRTTTTRIVDGKFLSADCGSIKPIQPPPR